MYGYSPACISVAAIARTDYDKHHDNFEKASKAKPRILIALIAFLFLYLFISGGLWRHDLEHNVDGYQLRRYLYFISSPAPNGCTSTAPHAERICSVIEKGGCDTVLSTKSFKFFGLFGWSEVGFAYFSVKPESHCLFFRVIPHRWLSSTHVAFPSPSGAYGIRKSVPKAWCTLCLCVQSLLWLRSSAISGDDPSMDMTVWQYRRTRRLLYSHAAWREPPSPLVRPQPDEGANLQEQISQ